MNRTLRVLLLAVPSLAFAQSAAVSGRGSSPINEIERGFYVRGAGGPFFLTKAPANSGPKPFSSGQMVQVELGYEFNERLSLGLFGMATANRAGSDYVGKSGGAASGDFSTLIPGAVLRLNAAGVSDDHGVKRTWFYLRGGAGYVKFYPKALLPDADTMLFVGPGIDYYTRLRHFAVGLEVTGVYLVNSQSFGFSVTPNLRYAF
jgi:hypothetical protein